MRKILKLISWISDYFKSYIGLENYNKEYSYFDFEILNAEINNFEYEVIPRKIRDVFFNDLFNKKTDVLGGVVRNISTNKGLCFKDFLFIGPINTLNYFKLRRKISNNYIRINWNKDEISGNHLLNIRHHFLRGELFFGLVDIKFIWEIARFHELLSLAILINNDDDNKEKYLMEYTSRFYDFTSSNPVGYGPNWTCAMEVGIRCINFILSFSLLYKSFNNEFHKDANQFINESYNFIIRNLENQSDKLNNHYLTNLVSLIFIAKYSKNKDEEYNKYSKEFINEINNQFNDDGTCFEGSTSYHCLSFELMKIGYFALKKDSKILIKDKLLKASYFIHDMYYNENDKHRIGDDDSGKIIKTIYDYQINTQSIRLFGVESINKKIMSNINELMEITPKKKYLCNDFFDNKLFKIYLPKRVLDSSSHVDISQDINIMIPKVSTYSWLLNNNIIDIIIYPNFGAIIIKYDGASIFFRVGGQDSGHRHEDELHADIFIKDKYEILDSGSVNYTLFRKVRNLYRSAEAHFVPYKSCSDLNELFKLKIIEKTEVSIIKKNNVYKITALYGHYKRELYFFNGGMKILDYKNNNLIINSEPSYLLSTSTKYGSLSNEKIINCLSSL